MDYSKFTVEETWGYYHNFYIITSSKNGWTGGLKAGTFNSRKEAQSHLDKLTEESKKDAIKWTH